MQFPFNLRSLFAESVTVWDTEAILHLEKNRTLITNLQQVVDRMGINSAKAQNLNVPITSLNKMVHTDQRLYIHTSDQTVDGILKVGHKKLFVANDFGELKEISPLCVLDFYVAETKQRSGIGKTLFDYMLMLEDITPEKLAYDRPSPKLLGFLNKHFGLRRYIPQANNYVVFKQYWADSKMVDDKLIQTITQRPLTKHRHATGVARQLKNQINSITINEPPSPNDEPQYSSTLSPQKSPQYNNYSRFEEYNHSPQRSPQRSPHPDPQYEEEIYYEPSMLNGVSTPTQFRVVALSKQSGRKNAVSAENMFAQPEIHRTTLAPVNFKRTEIPDPPNRTTPIKIASESRGPSIHQTQRFQNSPQQSTKPPNTILGYSNTNESKKNELRTANRTVDGAPQRAEQDEFKSPIANKGRSNEFQRQFYNKHELF